MPIKRTSSSCSKACLVVWRSWAPVLDAVRCYRECLKVSRNPDMLCATSHWLYMSLRRLRQDDDAVRVLEPIHAGMDVIENHGYHRLLLMYKSELDPDTLLREAMGEDTVEAATMAYGVANWFYCNGEVERARDLFRTIERGEQWAAFGHIAAEADLAPRSGGKPRR